MSGDILKSCVSFCFMFILTTCYARLYRARQERWRAGGVWFGER